MKESKATNQTFNWPILSNSLHKICKLWRIAKWVHFLIPKVKAYYTPGDLNTSVSKLLAISMFRFQHCSIYKRQWHMRPSHWTLQASSILLHVLYISTRLVVHMPASNSWEFSMVCSWINVVSSRVWKLAHAWSTGEICGFDRTDAFLLHLLEKVNRLVILPSFHMFYKSSIPWKIVPLYSAQCQCNYFCFHPGGLLLITKPQSLPRLLMLEIWKPWANVTTRNPNQNDQVCAHHITQKHNSYHSNSENRWPVVLIAFVFSYLISSQPQIC